MQKGLTKDISLLEVFPIVVATVVFGALMKKQQQNIPFYYNNMTVVSILNTMSSKLVMVSALLKSFDNARHCVNCLLKDEDIR